jgi:hypothetical protein
MVRDKFSIPPMLACHCLSLRFMRLLLKNVNEAVKKSEIVDVKFGQNGGSHGARDKINSVPIKDAQSGVKPIKLFHLLWPNKLESG